MCSRYLSTILSKRSYPMLAGWSSPRKHRSSKCRRRTAAYASAITPRLRNGWNASASCHGNAADPGPATQHCQRGCGAGAGATRSSVPAGAETLIWLLLPLLPRACRTCMTSLLQRRCPGGRRHRAGNVVGGALLDWPCGLAGAGGDTGRPRPTGARPSQSCGNSRRGLLITSSACQPLRSCQHWSSVPPWWPSPVSRWRR